MTTNYPQPPSASPAYSTYVRTGDQLIVGNSYRLELVGGGEGSDLVEAGRYYLATDVETKAGRLMVDVDTGRTFYTNASDVYTV